jgi:hypothetical protein
MARLVGCTVGWLALAGATAFAQPAVPSVPGDDIFGFTTATDPGNPGDLQYFNENDGRFGKRDGGYLALDSKFALGYTFAPNWWVGVAAFSAINASSGVTGVPDLDHLRFDGASIELEHRILERTASNPFAVTLDVEPRWGLIDGVTGLPSQSWQSDFKLFVDAPVRPDTVYWAGNVEYTVGEAEVPGDVSVWAPSSQLLLSTALTYQSAPNLFFGGEARYFSMSDNATLSHEIGRALYLGPTFLWKVTDKIALNVTLQPQVYGRSIANPSRALDLDDFERAQFRAKLVVGF